MLQESLSTVLHSFSTCPSQADCPVLVDFRIESGVKAIGCWGSQDSKRWHEHITSRINGTVKLVGPTISCEGSPKEGKVDGEWRTNPHVQSYVLATDQVRLDGPTTSTNRWPSCLGASVCDIPPVAADIRTLTNQRRWSDDLLPSR